MSKEVTLGQLVKFVLDNRKGNAFRDYHEPTIASYILRGAKEQTMLYSTNAIGVVVGIIVCFKEESKQLMHVNDVLTIEPWVLPHFVMHFKQHFPNYTLTALRRGKQITYKNTMKLCSKILKGKV